jgi:hypothetical protein
MTEYYIFWLASIFLALLSATMVVALGTLLLSKIVEDLSNSTMLSSYALRAFRLFPGAAIVLFGCLMLWLIVEQILQLKLPG